MSSQLLRWAGRFEIAITIEKPNYPIGISDVQILRIIPRRIKCDPKRLVQTVFDECFDDIRFSAASGIAQRLDSICPTFHDEDVAIGRGEQKTRIAETAGVQFDIKTGWNPRLSVCRTINDASPVNCQNVRTRRRQVLDCDFASDPGRIARPIAHGCLAREKRPGLGGRGSAKCEYDADRPRRASQSAIPHTLVESVSDW
jgi:hypothetical protein